MTFQRHRFPSLNLPSRTGGLDPLDRKTIWAIGGGKGGIGKTILTSNMAVYLSWLNKRVVVVDLDLGGSNLHTAVGVDPPTKTLGDLISGRVADVHDMLLPTPIRGLQILSGAHDPAGITHLDKTQMTHLVAKLGEIQADYILLDLGAGTSSNTLDFFLAADQKIVLVTPEPTSIENAYRFIKLAFYRMLRMSATSAKVCDLIESAMDMKSAHGIRSPRDLLAEVRRQAPDDGADLQMRMERFAISLIVNQVRVKSESDIGKSITLVCERYFGMKVDYQGYLPYDSSVWQSIRHRVPFLIDSPNSQAVTHLESILRNLLKTNQTRAAV